VTERLRCVQRIAGLTHPAEKWESALTSPSQRHGGTDSQAQERRNSGQGGTLQGCDDDDPGDIAGDDEGLLFHVPTKCSIREKN